MKKRSLRLGSILLSGKNNHVVVISEIAGAHEGQLEAVFELIQAAKQNGADCVKLQMISAQRLLSAYHPRFEHFKKIEFSQSIWKRIIDFANSIEIPLLFDVFDEYSIAFLETQKGIIGYKIHSTDLNNPRILAAAGQTQKVIILGIGGSTEFEIFHSIRALSAVTSKIILMPGFQAFPTQLADLHLNQISYFSRKYPFFVGYTDHVDAQKTEDAITIPLFAVLKGARVIEKHITLDRSKKGIDYYSALEPGEFKTMVQKIRTVHSILGKESPVLGAAEIDYRKKMKKCVVAARPLRQGAIISEQDMAFKRAPSGVPIIEKDKLINRKLLRSKKSDESIELSDLDYPVIACIAVRMHSTRLPNKALLKIQDLETIRILIRRLKQSERLKKVVLCTSDHPMDQVLVQIAHSENIGCIAGSEKDVMARFIQAAEQFGGEVVVRVTGDDILTDINLMENMIAFHIHSNADYTYADGLPKGVETEIITVQALKKAHQLAEDPSWTEYMTWYLKNPQFFHIEQYPLHQDLMRSDIRLTLDHYEDFLLISRVVDHLYPKNPLFDTQDIIRYFNQYPSALNVNRNKTARTKVKGINVKMKFSTEQS